MRSLTINAERDEMNHSMSNPHPRLRGRLRYHEPLSAHTTWRVGGPAERFYVPADVPDLVNFVRILPPDEPLFWLGLGSNLLVRDGGIPGTVVCTTGMEAAVKPLEGRCWRVECGASCAKVARSTSRAGAGGAEFLAGIPGTFGGALAMNAGAFGGETWPLVRAVTTLDHTGRVRCRYPGDYRIGYRSVQGPAHEWFLAAYLQLASGTGDSARIRELLEQRKQSQPIGLPSCGSVFRNPPPENIAGTMRPRYAARLIESCGLKGVRIGGAEVSPKHANFIINTGQASAADIENLIELVQERVETCHEVRLQPEVRIVGIGSAVV